MQEINKRLDWIGLSKMKVVSSHQLSVVGYAVCWCFLEIIGIGTIETISMSVSVCTEIPQLGLTSRNSWQNVGKSWISSEENTVRCPGSDAREKNFLQHPSSDKTSEALTDDTVLV